MEFYNILEKVKESKKAILVTEIEECDKSRHMLIIDDNDIYTDDEELKKIDISLFGDISLGVKEIEGKKYFIEPIGKENRLIVCGGGHVAQAVVKVAKILGFKVIALEDRLSFVNALKKAGADEVLYDAFETSIDSIKGDNNTFFVILTRGHKYDIECLSSVLKKNYAYLGMISSKYRAATAKKTMKSLGFEEDKISTLHSPIGINISSQTPEEIAVAIMAEIILEKNSQNKKSGFSEEMLDFIKDAKNNMVIATIINRKGSSPRDVGTKMIITEDLTTIGTIGGGCAEAEVISKSKEVMITGKNKIYRVDMTGKTAIEDEGMICGGIIDVFIEKI